MRHGIVTIVTPIRADRDENVVRNRLRDLSDDVLPREHLIGLHFASLSVIGQYPDAPRDFTPHLVFEASFDGTREDFIDDLVATAGPSLDFIYQDCTDYPQPGTQLPQVVKNYLFRHDVGADCAFFAYPGRTVGQIQQEHQLRNTLVELDRCDRNEFALRNLSPPSQRSLVSLLRRQIAAIPALQGALTLPERPFLVTYGPQIANAVLSTVGAIVFLGLVVSVSDRSGPVEGLLAVHRSWPYSRASLRADWRVATEVVESLRHPIRRRRRCVVGTRPANRRDGPVDDTRTHRAWQSDLVEGQVATWRRPSLDSRRADPRVVRSGTSASVLGPEVARRSCGDSSNGMRRITWSD